MPGSAWPAEVLARRRGERDALLITARAYVDALAETLDLIGAAVIGSVARGDFNVWSDIDVLVVAHDLPSRYLDRATLLTSAPAPRVQAFAFTPKELTEAQTRCDPRVVELLELGVFLIGEQDVRALMRG